MNWLNLSTLFDQRLRMEKQIQSLEHDLKNSQSEIDQLASERDVFRAKADALEKLKNVFIDETIGFFCRKQD